MRSRLRSRAFVPSLVLCLSTVGCGNAVYVIGINGAERQLEQARAIGAERYAPYEYYGAEARIAEAKRQAAEAEYGNASSLADEASRLAHEATVKSQAHRAKGIQ